MVTRPRSRKLTREQLEEILEAHKRLLESHGEEGERADLREAKLPEADLREANLQEADLVEANLQGTNFIEANLGGANFINANLQEANLREANLQSAALYEANLKGAKLQITNLRGADLREANLQAADLYEANLQEANFLKANLEGADLSEANLQGAVFHGANLRGAKLRGTDLRGANLIRTDLKNADLMRARLREANLQDADLTNAKGLLSGQLGGANVSGAELPEPIRKFEEGLKVVEEASKNSRKLFFGMLLGCAYALLTVATTTDVRLLTNSASSPLPIIGAEIPIVLFYIVAPFILLGLYSYFHLYMQHLWEGLAKLPAIFPDGRSLDEKAYPWLLTGLVRAHLYRLREERPPLSKLREWISIFLAWMFVPATLICFWLRYLPRQDWFGTGVHIVLFAMAVWAGIMLYRLAVGTLQGNESELALWKKPLQEKRTYKRGAIALRLGMIVLLFSLGTINGVGMSRFELKDVRTWVPNAFEWLGFSPYADFQEKDVSQKPSNWTGLKQQEVHQVKGALLKRRNLRYANAERAFLVKADLRWADLSGAFMLEADVREANLLGAKLKGTGLYSARLQGANLQDTNLEEAYLPGAKLQKATLNFANLQRANLLEAELEEANLEWANLEGAIFRGAKGLTKEQLSKAKNHLLAIYDVGLLVETLHLREEHYDNLKNKSLRGYNLKESNFSDANLEGFDLSETNLQEASLLYTNLRGADLQRANLEGASLMGANLEGADLRGANLEEALLFQVHLRGANLKGAKLWNADFLEADLRGARGLTIEQVSKVGRLTDAKLDPELSEKVKKNYPHLLEEPKPEE